MLAACEAHIDATDVLLMAAAPADFRPNETQPHKVKKQNQPGPVNCLLVGTPDILLTLDARRRGCFTVGFAAETRNALAYGQDKLQRKNLDMLVANTVGTPDTGFASDTNPGWLVRRDAPVVELPLQSKIDLAHSLLQHISDALAKK